MLQLLSSLGRVLVGSHGSQYDRCVKRRVRSAATDNSASRLPKLDSIRSCLEVIVFHMLVERIGNFAAWFFHKRHDEIFKQFVRAKAQCPAGFTIDFIGSLEATKF